MTQRNAVRAPGLGLLALVAAAACTDGPALVSPAPEAAPIPVMQCLADVPSLSVQCTSTSGSQQGQGVSLNRLVGGQDVYVKLANTGNTYFAESEIFQITVTVQNLTRQALGTSDGSTVDGVKVFFSSGPTVVAGTGEVTVANPTGHEFVTAPAQPYFLYSEILAPYEISSALPWQFSVPAEVTRFTFVVYVQAPQPDESLPLLDEEWTGDVSSAWTDALNWSDGSVPDSSSTVAIPSASLMPGDSMPRLQGSTTLTHLRVGTGSTLYLSGHTLRAMGNVDAAGSISGGSLEMRGTGALLRGSVPALNVNGGVSLQGSTVASGAVSVAGGSLNVKDQALSISIP